MLAFLFVSLAAVQGAGERPARDFERDVAVGESLRIVGEPADCLSLAENRRSLSASVRALGLTPGPRSIESRDALTVVTVPQPHFDRSVHHYLSLVSSLCTPFGEPSYPCLSVYAARIEAPIRADGQPVPSSALNDPDRITLALLEAARDIARRCGHPAEASDD